jgi:hypothetical protein
MGFVLGKHASTDAHRLSPCEWTWALAGHSSMFVPKPGVFSGHERKFCNHHEVAVSMPGSGFHYVSATPRTAGTPPLADWHGKSLGNKSTTDASRKRDARDDGERGSMSGRYRDHLPSSGRACASLASNQNGDNDGPEIHQLWQLSCPSNRDQHNS